MWIPLFLQPKDEISRPNTSNPEDEIHLLQLKIKEKTLFPSYNLFLIHLNLLHKTCNTIILIIVLLLTTLAFLILLLQKP